MLIEKTKKGNLIISGKVIEADTMFNKTKEQVCITVWGTQSSHCCHIGINDIDLYILELQELKNIFEKHLTSNQ